MATDTNPLNRERVLVQAQSTGDRYQAPTTNAALQLAESLRDIQPTVGAALDVYAQGEAEKKRAQAKRDALITHGQTLADAVREGKLKATQNPWYMEAYAKEGAALRSQDAFTALQVDSATWAEKNDPEAFAKKWAEGVAGIAKGFSSKDEIAGFAPVQAQFTQQALQTNTAHNVKRIEGERQENNSVLAADALARAASQNGGQLTAQQAIEAMRPAHDMWIGTGGTEQEWHTMAASAITTAAYKTQNAGLMDLTKGIGLDGKPMLDGKFGNGAAPTPTPVVRTPKPALATAALPAAHRLPVQGGVTVKGGEYGARRGAGKVHHGLDLAIPEGTPVVSPGAGTVIEVGHSRDAGNFVRVDHGGGIISSYSHLSKQSVAKGAVLTPGQALGLSGSTGHSTGPHLHWRVKVNGTDVNPQSVAFPQGNAVARVAEEVSAPTAPLPTLVEAASAPQIARGPSLYDIAGVADAAESDRYHITQASEEATMGPLRRARAQVQARGFEATSYLYQVHGTDILMGSYDPKALSRELEQQGFNAAEIASAFSQLHEATSDSAGLMQDRLRIQGADPSAARDTMDLALEGERDGYSPAYQAKVEAAVASGKISGDDGIRYVSNAHSRSRQKESEARSDRAEARAAERANPQGVHSAAQVLEMGNNLAGLAASFYQQITGQFPSEQERKKAKSQITAAMGAHLARAPGDYDGAVLAGRQAAANYGMRIRAPLSRTAPQAIPHNPRGD